MFFYLSQIAQISQIHNCGLSKFCRSILGLRSDLDRSKVVARSLVGRRKVVGRSWEVRREVEVG